MFCHIILFYFKFRLPFPDFYIFRYIFYGLPDSGYEGFLSPINKRPGVKSVKYCLIIISCLINKKVVEALSIFGLLNHLKIYNHEKGNRY